jgi:hypothetical protein
MAGATTREIMEAAGHKTMSQAARYSHLTHQHTQSVVDRIATGTGKALKNQHAPKQAPEVLIRMFRRVNHARSLVFIGAGRGSILHDHMDRRILSLFSIVVHSVEPNSIQRYKALFIVC